MATHRTYLTILFVLHLLVNLTHGYSHTITQVELTTFQTTYVALIIFALPAYALFLLFRGRVKQGAALFALSMIAGFLFGYGFHFIFDTPDLHSNVVGPGAGGFFHSALWLAVIQFTSFFYSIYVWQTQSQ
ncbi:MAG: hypothetical protein AAF702_26245 [Chloroflexota bacterium]